MINCCLKILFFVAIELPKNNSYKFIKQFSLKIMKNIIKYLITIIFILVLNNSYGVVYHTVSNGNFNADNIWSPSKPKLNSAFNDTIVLSHTIDLNTSLGIYGTFIISQNATLTNTSKDLTLTSGSKLINNGSANIGSISIVSGAGFENNGNFTLNGELDNYGIIINTGSLTAILTFKNKNQILNTNTINALQNFQNDVSTSIDNIGTINVLVDLNNSGYITNDGSLIVDGYANSISGTIDGDGSLCNSDGITDPTGGSKAGVFCAICVGEGSTLPVTLVDLSAIIINNHIKIRWTTAAEINNNYFEILRSSDGHNYVVAGQVNGQGNSNSLYSYEFIDENPNIGINYYKLRQVDFDRTNTDSQVLTVSMVAEIDATIFPNPVNRGNQININSTQQGDLRVDLYNIAGQIVGSYQNSSSQVTIPTDEFEAGIYLFRIFQNNSTIVKKIQVN